MFGGNMGGMLKQVQKMQENMEKAQKELENIEVEGESAGGLVKITATCKNVVKRVNIDETLLSEDRDMLEDLVAAALNDTLRKAEEKAAEHMSELTNGMQLPPGMKMPF
ncbi:YbaB/EbfC family nucleoid-associated protein [Ostreibacterium oceani]|uniref:Nucleoid-associated protein GCU85_03365 n=1 Tax=Ostreibacterium oceani TaxID=2654998 RepID=A0A6N7EZ60_9GAMM|nr:YbaB/EbfC family nucleoid-associated protein [Ostreibacterium oceani]MPV85778.1 YbaB/EbfC family nucleoid-associated protein [Ostreibacterium oceani]